MARYFRVVTNTGWSAATALDDGEYLHQIQSTDVILSQPQDDPIVQRTVAEKALAAGHQCRMIICGDDVSVGRQGSLVGRRGLAGQHGFGLSDEEAHSTAFLL